MGALIFRYPTRGPGRRGPILVVQRAGSPLKGWWSLPGGLVETGETLEQAVQREVLEETGLRVKPLELYGVFQRIMPDAKGRPEYHYILVDYVCKIEGGTLKAADDVARVEWVPVKRLRQYQMTEGTLAVIEEASARELRKRT
ncbi:MAG: NUDIX hydrolase [Acidobacteriota bacterium]